MKLLLSPAVPLLLASTLFAADPQVAAHSFELAKPGRTLLSDDFTQPEKANRRLTRGDWKVASGIAACAHDDELFKKYKNHGPAIWYDHDFQNAVIRFDFLAGSACKHFVFTVNGKGGHVCRFVMNDAGTDLRAWDADHKPKQLAKNGPALPKNQWTPVTVELVGSKACVHIGDSYVATVEDPSYAAAKTVVGVSFHFGDLKLRNFQLVEATSR
jgi:hypothetical protein